LDPEGAWTGAPQPYLPSACWQLWTPNKALGLTGVRAAYAIAPPDGEEQALGLTALAPSWPVGAHGVAMLQAWAASAVQQWVADCMPTLCSWKDRQVALCTQLGWSVVPGSLANYFVATLPTAQCAGDSRAQTSSLLAALRQHGIKLRDCTSFGLPGAVRLGVLPPASQDALQAAWQAVHVGGP
jgi:histidinol-phosphate aminotransferase